MNLAPTKLTDEERNLQTEVRAFLDERLPPGTYPLGLGMAGDVDPDFSRDLAAQGWVGMALPTEYGGGGRTAVERQIVVEELLTRGAPIGFHWTADRQSGLNILHNGTEEQRRELLPGIARGEYSFAIGMSEPDAGSDLASLRSKAVREGNTWHVNGTKIWTSGAATATHILGLFRTSDDRHGGMTQFIIPAGTPGMRISPIPFIDGTQHFCEVVFDDLQLSDAARLGEVGAGWGQNTSELALERGGVDRWMSLMPILERWATTETVRDSAAAQIDLGRILARLWAYRGMSLSIARLVDAGRFPVVEAALVKEMATQFEQESLALVRRHYGRAPSLNSADPWEALLAQAILVAPSWTLRGGTTEILRSVISKGLVQR
ncbi:alkylation response protein AidB-like acyl-CoA dehydrogenase [Nocardioides marinisabuli]|uniref:Alkylation response protein AidB-like acyl-CoA dehydrogenase n=1 Tax=Nocardioides marinisabuli TaxID=419476 RepID=A0A7Y9F0N8_9ACTN|nr:acyl-CoA dehydrogenase family protein [Nocardioides marinisabuli]NYD57161.1 alkylation response protein AidB-like acyl-CoA dehydrogenase [Nocardioides marinisabuli]